MFTFLHGRCSNNVKSTLENFVVLTCLKKILKKSRESYRKLQKLQNVKENYKTYRKLQKITKLTENYGKLQNFQKITKCYGV